MTIFYHRQMFIKHMFNLNEGHDDYRVKSGNFGHQANLDIHLQTMEIQMSWRFMSRLIMISTVCLIYFKL